MNFVFIKATKQFFPIGEIFLSKNRKKLFGR